MNLIIEGLSMGIDLEKVCAIIVTYDNRFHFLNEALNGCIQNGVKKLS